MHVQIFEQNNNHVIITSIITTNIYPPQSSQIAASATSHNYAEVNISKDALRIQI